MKSPSPVSVLNYGILTLYATFKHRKLYSNTLQSFTYSFFALGSVVLASDLLWCIFCGLRFGMHYNGLLQLIIAGLRDFAGTVSCMIIVKDTPFSTFIGNEKLWILNGFFLFFWFFFAPDPSFTDWTFALKYDYGWGRALFTFFLSHIVGRVLTGLIYVKGWFHE